MTRRPVWHRIGLLLVAAVGLVPAAACSDDEPKRGEARLDIDGRAEVERQDGTDEVLTDDDRLRTGDRIALVEGEAVLRLGDGTTLELRAGRGDADDTVVVMGPTPVLEAGDLLVVTDDELEIDVADTSVTVTDGAARLSRGVGLTAGSYSAEVHLDSAGATRQIDPLRQLSVASLGQPPTGVTPLVVDPADPWDRRFLSDAIDAGSRLEALASGFTANLRRGTTLDVAFFTTVVPALVDQADVLAELLDPDRPAGDTVVGAAIAQLGARGTFAERWASVFAFRDSGAGWGLVARDQGVDGQAVVDAVRTAVDTAPLATPTTRPVGTDPSAAPPTGPGGGSGGSDPGSVVTTTTSTLPAPVLPSPPPAEEGQGLLDPILDPLLSPVTNVLNSLIGGLLGGLS